MEPIKDAQTVTPDGRPVGPEIDGLVMRALTTVADGRGDLCELYDPAWGVHDAPLVFAYLSTIQPGVAKAWIRHRRQDDRIAAVFGRMLWAFYDDRPGSPTHGVVQRITVTERNRLLITIPCGVWHGVHNVGTVEAAFVNLPTRPYDHADPDKERLPADTDAIPFRFRGLDARSG